uniref:Uncharacterized protein n=1 Tax=Meloidogyne javanica TaxID=6303 RepID=A0A915LH69_MELJA
MKLVLLNSQLLLFLTLLHIPSFLCFTYTHSQAMNLLQNEGISISSTGRCSNRNNPQCTSLEGIHSEAIDGIITLKKASGCPIIITGGTETDISQTLFLKFQTTVGVLRLEMFI